MSTSRTTRWLDDREQQTWVELSPMILRLAPVLGARLQREFNISQFEYLILARLSETPGSMLRMSVLATVSGSSIAAAFSDRRAPGKARLDITAARCERSSLHGGCSDPRGT